MHLAGGYYIHPPLLRPYRPASQVFMHHTDLRHKYLCTIQTCVARIYAPYRPASQEFIPPSILAVYYYQQRVIHSPAACHCAGTPAVRLKAKVADCQRNEQHSMRDTHWHGKPSHAQYQKYLRSCP